MAKVYLVGAGPGDPELLTVKAARLLEAADVILYDRLVSPAILALARPGAELVYVGKERGCAEETQKRIFSELALNALRGRTVVRLKGGDPMVFGRGAEEWAYLARLGVDVEVVPGISSAVAVPALAAIPLTARGVARSFAVVTGHVREGFHEEWRNYRDIDTLVILMGITHRQQIAQALLDAGRSPEEPCAFIERGSTPEERILLTNLAAIAKGETTVANPAVWITGQVVHLRETLKSPAQSQNPTLDALLTIEPPLPLWDVV
jgi:uroporphyrin-III C-methyltransferase